MSEDIKSIVQSILRQNLAPIEAKLSQLEGNIKAITEENQISVKKLDHQYQKIFYQCNLIDKELQGLKQQIYDAQSQANEILERTENIITSQKPISNSELQQQLNNKINILNQNNALQFVNKVQNNLQQQHERYQREPVRNTQPLACQTSNTLQKTVYKTTTGKKYHKEGCKFFEYSKYPISYSQALIEGLEGCKICKV